MRTPPAPTTLHVSGIRLVAVLPAVSQSREFIRQTLTDWRLSAEIDAAALVVSELVTNAVRSTDLTGPHWDDAYGHHAIGVQLRLLDTSLYVEVWDRGDGSPAIPQQSPEAEGGRGLFLVESVSERWGVHRPTVGGKVVWSELTLSTSANSPAPKAALPPRDPGRQDAMADGDVELADMALMQRVLEGFRSPMRRGIEAVAV